MTSPGQLGQLGQLWREKLRLRAALHSRMALTDERYSESNYFDDDARFSYSYQRLDLRAAGEARLYDAVHGDDTTPAGARVLGAWAASGMSAITATLRALDEEPRPRRLLHSADAYFETLQLLPRLRHLLPNSDDDQLLDGDIFYLDSVTANDRAPLLCARDLAPLRYLLFDTTCYDAGSPRLAAVVARALAAGVPVICLRSHLKLDCLATEHARLGSVAIVLPRDAPPSVHERAEALRERILAELVLTGGTATPSAFWPLAAHPRARALVAERNRRMVEAHARAAAALAGRLPPGLTLTAPHHGCFLLVDPFPVERAALRPMLQALADALTADGVEARPLASFGYDLIGLSHINTLDGAALRIALADYPDPLIDRAAARLADFLSINLPAAATRAPPRYR